MSLYSITMLSYEGRKNIIDAIPFIKVYNTVEKARTAVKDSYLELMDGEEIDIKAPYF